MARGPQSPQDPQDWARNLSEHHAGSNSHGHGQKSLAAAPTSTTAPTKISNAKTFCYKPAARHTQSVQSNATTPTANAMPMVDLMGAFMPSPIQRSNGQALQ